MDDPFHVSPGTIAALLGMTAATYLCRILGVWLMAHVPLTKPVRDGLAALPGSIVVAVVLPLGMRGGLPAMLGLAAGLATMIARRNELLALAVGLAVVAGARALGF